MAKHKHLTRASMMLIAAAGLAVSCQSTTSEKQTEEPMAEQTPLNAEPLVKNIYTADPSAHVFNGKIYIYPSHDIDAGVPEKDDGSHFAMRDYHVLSMDSIGGKVTDHGLALDIEDVPWAGRQMWAPDAAYKDGTYYFYFPAKDKQDVFRIGVATSTSPTGPFKAQEKPIEGSFSIDPAVFKDDDGNHYMYFGGIWGGQLQRWSTGAYNPADEYPADDQPALSPKVAKMSSDMLGFDGEVQDVQLLGQDGKPLLAKENDKRFFEAAWLHKYNGKYYFSYSTGDTHNIAYATGDSPYGPFTYQGVIL
ncbi:MAG: glycoside hydrolase family 43 protein, partial [Pontibacter sp.]|nr:glycoside hydrolase family 43 protein [Pontibacter sp.]